LFGQLLIFPCQPAVFAAELTVRFAAVVAVLEVFLVR
jgi:hypothetical protein